MARQSDFKWVNFDSRFSQTNQVETRNFQVDGNPVDTGYLLIQAEDVELGNHQIEINGKDLPSFDIPTHGNQQRFVWMDRVPPDFLKKGENRITIRRVGSEVFMIYNVAVHWREAA